VMGTTIRICVLVSSDDSFRQARARRRYLPLCTELSKIGAELSVVPIGNVGHVRELTHDVYIVSDCYDTLSLLLAQYLRRSNKLIGVDLVEDHFTATDAAGDPLCGWLSSMVEASDFLLCATPSLEAVAEQYAPGLPRHVVGERLPPCDPAKLALVFRDKLARFAQSRRLTVGWLAAANHPLGTVELTELGSFGEELGRLGRPGVTVGLQILTQGRVSADSLASLSHLGLPYEIHEWSEDRYDDLLRKSLVFFSPVDAHTSRSSLAESHAIAALLSGSQVLATGYPLPARLSPFLYRDARQLQDDLLAARPAVSERDAAELAQLSPAAPVEDASVLLAFLRAGTKRSATSHAASNGPLAAVLHGRNSPLSAHKHAQKLEALSVATPFALAKKLNFHVRFVPRPAGAGMDVLISESHRSFLTPKLRERLVSAGKILETSYGRIGLDEVLPDAVFDGLAVAAIDDPAASAAAYGPVATLVERALKALVPGIRCFHSDDSSLPLRTA
jgi:hypothetical protein